MLRTRKGLLLFKIEVTEGVDSVPTAGSDAILVQVTGSPVRPAVDLIETNEWTNSLDDLGDIVGGARAEMQFSVWLRGTSAPGTAPEWGPLMKVCGWAESLQATAIPAGAPEACAAGGSTTHAFLGASAGTTDDQYIGMPINISGAITLQSLITNYAGSTKDAALAHQASGAIIATSNYQIPANVRYLPASDNIPSGTAYLFVDGLRYVITGARGAMDFSIPTGEPGQMNFRLMGMWGGRTDVAMPASPVFDDENIRAPVFRAGSYVLNRKAREIRSFTLNTNGTLIHPRDPNQAQGFGPAIITRRKMGGSIDPRDRLQAYDDTIGDFLAGNKRPSGLYYGVVAGNKIGVTIPEMLYASFDPTDQEGLVAAGINYQAVGRDQGAFLALF